MTIVQFNLKITTDINIFAAKQHYFAKYQQKDYHWHLR